MNWYKISQSESRDKLISEIKNRFKTHPFFSELLNRYHIPVSDIDNNLEIVIEDLDGKFAEGNGKEIKIDTKVADNDLLGTNFHFLVHEFFHWIKRRSEALFYFNDKEEIQSFVLQMTWDILNGRNDDDISQRIYPIIHSHFEDKMRAKKLFLGMLRKAHKLAQIFSSKT